MNKKLYLHIGWHKTGSTSIQHFLLKNKQKLINEEKIYYPDEGLLKSAHHLISWGFRNIPPSSFRMGEVPVQGADEIFNDISNSAYQNNCNTVIVSSEDFCALQPDEIKQLVSVIQRHHFDIKMIAYLRRQDQFFESAYNMQVKWWVTRYKLDFSDYLKSHNTIIDYTSAIEGWANALGAENIILRPFNQEKLIGGDVRTDFCNTVGINWKNYGITIERTNISLSAQTLEFLKTMNNLDLQEDEHKKIVRRLLEYDAKQKQPKCVLFTPDERIAFLDMFKESNKVLERYFHNLDFLALNDKKLPEKNVKPLALSEFNKILKFAATCNPTTYSMNLKRCRKWIRKAINRAFRLG